VVDGKTSLWHHCRQGGCAEAHAGVQQKGSARL